MSSTTATPMTRLDIFIRQPSLPLGPPLKTLPLGLRFEA